MSVKSLIAVVGTGAGDVERILLHVDVSGDVRLTVETVEHNRILEVRVDVSATENTSGENPT